MRTLILVVTACICMTGCATGPSMTITTYSMSMSYWRDCVGNQAKYRAGDEECRSRSRPEPQWGAVREVDTRSFAQCSKIDCGITELGFNQLTTWLAFSSLVKDYIMAKLQYEDNIS